MNTAPLFKVIEAQDAGRLLGIPSVCSAHPLVIEASLRQSLDDGAPRLIEATCNQVNQEGGYTGMSPAAFRDYVFEVADNVGLPRTQLILGGDHLGPNPWKHMAAEVAMDKAETMVFAYARAGYGKIHLDASMACADDSEPLANETIARRAARLARTAEEGAREGGHPPPAYIIGTEVPVPGGAAEVLDTLEVTLPADAEDTLQAHREAFSSVGLASAYERVIGLVVQPGVEFGHENVIYYDPGLATQLSNWRRETGSFVFEAHSTDYQPEKQLAALVRDGFAILKVGPGLTFALREALYALDHIATEVVPGWPDNHLHRVMDEVMRTNPENWRKYYTGSEIEQHLLRQYSYSDRIRYYWNDKNAKAAVEQLLSGLDQVRIGETLISQYLPVLYPYVANGDIAANPHDLLIQAVRKPLQVYSDACKAPA